MTNVLPLDAILVLPRSARVVRATVLGAGFDLVGECDDVVDGLALAVLYRPDVVVVAREVPGYGPASREELRSAAGAGAEVLVCAADGSDAEDLFADLGAARARVLAAAGVPFERRIGPDRRREQDWAQVRVERRSGRERRGMQPAAAREALPDGRSAADATGQSPVIG